MTAGTPRKKARGGRSALVILSLFLAISGALRLGAGIGAAVANTATETSPNEPVAVNCPPPPLAVTQALLAREEKLAARESALSDRLAALALADQAIEVRLTLLKDVEAEVAETLARADGASEADLTRLTEMYQSMKPKDAAALFEAMDPDFAAGFLGRMRPEAAGALLAGLSPEKAYALSVLLAGRNALVPKN